MSMSFGSTGQSTRSKSLIIDPREAGTSADVLPPPPFSFSSLISLIADGPHHYHPFPGSNLTIFYRDASSALVQLVNQWLIHAKQELPRMFSHLHLHLVEINGKRRRSLSPLAWKCCTSLTHASLADASIFTISNATPLHEVTSETQACCALRIRSGSTLPRSKSSRFTFVSSPTVSVSASAHSSADN